MTTPEGGSWSERPSVSRLLVQGASASFLTRALGTGLAFGAHVLMARLLGADSYGDYFYALTIINILSLLCKFGMDTATLRFVPVYWAQSRWSLLRGFFRRARQVAWALSLLAAALIAVVAHLFRDAMRPELARAFVAGSLVLPFTVLIQVRSAGLQALKRIVQSQFPPEVARFLLLGAGVAAAVFLLDLRVTASLALLIEAAAIAVSLVLSNWLLGRSLPDRLSDEEPEYRTREWVVTAFPLSLISGLLLILNQTGVIAVGALAGTMLAGLFGVAARVASLISFGLTAVNSIAAPMISELYWLRKTEELQKMLSHAAIGLVVFSLVVGAGVITLGRFILSLFGPEFVAAYWALVILVIGQLVNALAGPSGFLMTMTGHERTAAKIILGGVILNIVLSVALIPPFGLVGAAIATTAAIAFWNIAMYLHVRRTIGVDPTVLGFLDHPS